MIRGVSRASPKDGFCFGHQFLFLVLDLIGMNSKLFR